MSNFPNSPYMMKNGLAWSNYGGKSFVLHGQMRLSPRQFLSPQFMINYRNHDGTYNRKGHRAALTLEYRINDK